MNDSGLERRSTDIFERTGFEVDNLPKIKSKLDNKSNNSRLESRNLIARGSSRVTLAPRDPSIP